MKISQNTNKKSFLKKLLIKLCRKVGYEIIDQNNLFVPSLNKFANQNLSNLQKDSISIPLGKVKITRKIKELSVIIRTYTSTEVEKSKIMLDQNKFRIFEISSPPNLYWPKLGLTLDTKDDFKFIKKIILRLGKIKPFFSCLDIIEFLKKNLKYPLLVHLLIV